MQALKVRKLDACICVCWLAAILMLAACKPPNGELPSLVKYETLPRSPNAGGDCPFRQPTEWEQSHCRGLSKALGSIRDAKRLSYIELAAVLIGHKLEKQGYVGGEGLPDMSFGCDGAWRSWGALYKSEGTYEILEDQFCRTPATGGERQCSEIYITKKSHVILRELDDSHEVVRIRVFANPHASGCKKS